MNVQAIVSGLFLLGSSSAAVALAPACAPTIEKAWIRAAPPGAMMLAGYATVKNSCSRAVAISAVDAGDFASAMIHETLVENGVSKMRHASSLPLAAHGMLRFAPGGRHLMLMNPKRQLKEGDQLGITLLLVDGRNIRADFTVRKNAPD